jgi:hypothetical protein
MSAPKKRKMSPKTAAKSKARHVRPHEAVDAPRYPMMERPLEHAFHDYAELRRDEASV